jgi:dTMP kinase
MASCLQGRAEIVITREPGGTPLGERLRALLLDPDQRLHPETEALLMFAARREHIDKVILPALDAGKWVVCDRFTDATYAYQAGGSGLDWRKIAALESWVHPTLQPDLTIYLDVRTETARARAHSARIADRYEQERASFHERVRAAYLRRAAENPDRIRVVDAERSIAQVREDVARTLAELLERGSMRSAEDTGSAR